VHKDILPLDLL
jgi:hypothetical protein